MSPTISTDSIAEEEASASSEQSTSVEVKVQALRTLLEGDDEEQRETFEFLKNALEEDRPSNHRLFQ